MADASRGRRLGRLVSLAWLLVLLMMLSAAGWSISGTLTGWGMPHWLAIALSLMFDLSGLICATYAHRAIERGTAAGLPRLALLGFVAVSGALNWHHGQQIGGPVAGFGLASVSAAVELLFELHRRDVRDEQRAAAGLVAERLPYVPLVGWVMFPRRSWSTVRGAVGQRLDALADGPTTQPSPAPQRGAAAGVVDTAAAPSTPPVGPVYNDDRCAIIRPLYDDGNRPSTSSMRAALVAAGHRPPADSIIRGQLRAEVERLEPHLTDLPAEPQPLRKAAP